MSALAQQQSALLEALFTWPAQDAIRHLATLTTPQSGRGLKAYQTNGHVLAQRALQAAYPVLAQLLGEESFGDLARALWHSSPPRTGDLACWGDTLADFVQSSTQLQDTPYLGDVARVEWTMHSAMTAADVLPDAASLALLTTHDPAGLAFVLAAGATLVCSAWPVVSITNAHLLGAPEFSKVGEQLILPVAQNALVWRQGMRPSVRETLPGEADLLSALLGGQSLARALDAAPALDFPAWLPMALQSRLVLGAIQLPTA